MILIAEVCMNKMEGKQEQDKNFLKYTLVIRISADKCNGYRYQVKVVSPIVSGIMRINLASCIP